MRKIDLPLAIIIWGTEIHPAPQNSVNTFGNQKTKIFNKTPIGKIAPSYGINLKRCLQCICKRMAIIKEKASNCKPETGMTTSMPIWSLLFIP